MPTPYEHARVKAYLRTWRQRAWADTWRFERRWGLWIGLVAGLVTVLLVWLVEGGDVSVLTLIWTLIAGGVVVWALVFLVAWFVAPAWLDLQREAMEGGDEPGPIDQLQALGMPDGGRDGPPIVSFPTRGENNRVIMLEPAYREEGWPITAIRFLEPRERIVYAADPLPVIIRLSFRGRLVVKDIRINGMLIEEHRSRGVMVRAEIYRRPPARQDEGRP